jgi:hypothetical protein
MSPPDLDPDLAAALEVLAELGPLQVLDLYPTPPRRRPTPSLGPAPAPALGRTPTAQPLPAPAAARSDPRQPAPPHPVESRLARGPDRRRRPALPHPTDLEVPPLMWSSLPSNLRTVLGTALLLGIGVAVAAFTLSFFALREAAQDPALKWGSSARSVGGLTCPSMTARRPTVRFPAV